MGLRDGLAADAACAGVRAVAVVVEISCVGRAVVLRDVGRFGMPTVGADAAFIKVMFFDADTALQLVQDHWWLVSFRDVALTSPVQASLCLAKQSVQRHVP